MSVNLDTIKTLTKKLAVMNIIKYNSLAEIKEDFDSIASELIDLDSSDTELIKSLKNASNYFNLLTEEDFNTDDIQKINESKAVISKFTKELNTTIVKWRKDLGFL
jgi:hypothetical protein